MSSFEYFTTLLSIILGFSLLSVVRSIGRILISSNGFGHIWLTGIWNLALLIQLIIYWVVIWRLFNFSEAIRLWELILYSFATAILYLATFVLESKGEKDDSWRASKRPRSVFFGCLAIHMLAVTSHAISLDGFANGNIMGAGLVLLCLVGLTLEKRAHHLFLVCLYIATQLSIGFLAFSSSFAFRD